MRKLLVISAAVSVGMNKVDDVGNVGRDGVAAGYRSGHPGLKVECR